MLPMIEVPPAFAASTVEREGRAGEVWVAALPTVVRELCDQWRLVPDGPPTHGYVALVVPVTRDGTGFVLKVSWIDRSSEQEALALRAWRGRGAVHLLDARNDLGAMLLERLNAARTLDHVTSEEAVRVAATLLRRLSIPAPAELRSMSEEVAILQASFESQWAALGQPFPRRLLDHTLELFATLSGSASPLIVNQDLHYGNVLEGTREKWLVIDPKPLAGEIEFGIAQLLWSRFDELKNRADFERRLAIILKFAEADVDRARGWSLVRVIEYWLWALGLGFTQDPEKCRILVEWLKPELAC